ncbi:hypothetical protein LshimejAT787_0111950 [Lyophyllum shimeji]|uniref:Cyanovirin-N domain-containing protein n=1 Tax=Lyophyllum shimeji TaxID=47721 RepID=A0A9P3PEB8_LYOSH|nr:hypothetical protein LshimejAT787_0111950 [Lyophyllum shimeji]
MLQLAKAFFVLSIAAASAIAVPTSVQGIRGSILHALCEDGHGGITSTTLDLNGCLGNKDGILVYPGDRYRETCQYEQLPSDVANGKYGCDCEDGTGKFKRSTIDLFSIVSNKDGQLSCTP